MNTIEGVSWNLFRPSPQDSIAALFSPFSSIAFVVLTALGQSELAEKDEELAGLQEAGTDQQSCGFSEGLLRILQRSLFCTRASHAPEPTWI